MTSAAQVQVPPVMEAVLAEATQKNINWNIFKVSELETGKQLLKAPLEEQLECILASYLLELDRVEASYYADRCRQALIRKKFDLSVERASTFLKDMAGRLPGQYYNANIFLSALNFVQKTSGLQDPILWPTLEKIREHFLQLSYGEGQKILHLINQVLARQEEVALDHDLWGEWARHSLQQMADAERWAALLHRLNFEGKTPTKQWFTEATKHIEAYGLPAFVQNTTEWLGLLRKQTLPAGVEVEGQVNPRVPPSSQMVLKKLVFAAQALQHPGLMAPLTEAAIQCLKKVPGVGPRAPHLGILMAKTLGTFPPLQVAPHVERMRQTVKQESYQAELDRVMAELAEKAGLTPEQLAEYTVPTFGLQQGSKTYPFGTHHAVLTVEQFEARLQWFTSEGKAIKSVPAAIKTQHKTALQEIKAELADLDRFLSVYSNRIEGHYLNQWQQTLQNFEEHHLHHPLLSQLCQKLIWSLDGQGLFWLAGQWVNAQGEAVQPGPQATVTLWHPALDTLENVQQWRTFLLERGITQPFKQAHREVYLLTAAEERTGTYSNRFAAHIIKQHQFNALCAQRGWHNSLRLMVDDAYPPAHKNLQRWGLRAEFWIEGIGDNYGTDTTPSGSYLYLNTDQVRFYPIDAAHNMAHAGGGGYGRNYWRNQQVPEPLPLKDIPPLVLSEVLRDVDLFVGVCSVGNDPNWTDGGANARHRDYWQSYSFGELSATAETRRELLARLVPRLKIRDVAKVDGKFLRVQGQRRTYKIHLGSGNILMEPNDQYLCIVPDATLSKGASGVYLPFEGDRTLSIILSKAFLLSEDSKITDPTITRQL